MIPVVQGGVRGGGSVRSFVRCCACSRFEVETGLDLVGALMRHASSKGFTGERIRSALSPLRRRFRHSAVFEHLVVSARVPHWLAAARSMSKTRFSPGSNRRNSSCSRNLLAIDQFKVATSPMKMKIMPSENAGALAYPMGRRIRSTALSRPPAEIELRQVSTSIDDSRLVELRIAGGRELGVVVVHGRVAGEGQG
jgi:hypothetical protein